MERSPGKLANLVRPLATPTESGGVSGDYSAHHEEGDMPDVRYVVERQKAHSNAWIIKFDDEEYGPYKSQSEAVRFAIDAAEKRNDHGEKAQVVIIGPTWTYDHDISRGSW